MFIFYTKQAETGSHFYVPSSFLKESKCIEDIIYLTMREKRLIPQDLRIQNSRISAPGPGSAYLQDLLTQAPGQHSSPVAIVSHLYALCKITVDVVGSTAVPIGAEPLNGQRMELRSFLASGDEAGQKRDRTAQTL